TGTNLLVADVAPEHHGRICDRPGKVNVTTKTLLGSDTVLQAPFIEHIARKFGQTRMHSVLDVQADWLTAKNNKALEEGLMKTCTGCLLIHNNRSQLLVITDQNNLFTAQYQRNHAFWLGRLSALIYQYGP